MSRSGARDRARRQLTESLAVLGDGATLLCRSREWIEQIDTEGAAQYLADLDAFCSRPFPAQVDQHPDNQAIDQFAAAMKTKLAQARAEGRNAWIVLCVQNKQLADLLAGQVPKGKTGNIKDRSRDQTIAEGVTVCRQHLDPERNDCSEDELFSVLQVPFHNHENWNSSLKFWVVQTTQESS
ncbi:hypothetical protein [Pseudomonas viridiflava]|uniref:hypothetical protein n=1 Tax=Pseudomonas viridiflava TaxID=33069 RepID=UPI000F0208EB|nr:hypothetical protein [Pseudomonas viridiflava]